MKKTVLVSLFVFISFLANAQNWKSHPKKPYSGTDSCLVWQDSTKKFYRIKCSEINTGGSSAIDTTKVGRIEQGRGSTPFLLYFNGTAWVMNDTSYVPASGSNKMNGAYLNKISGTQTFGVEYPNANPLLNVDAKLTFSENGMIFNQQKNESVITGNYNIDPSTQNPKVEFRSRIAAAPNTDGSNIYFGLYAKDDGTGKIIANGSKVVGNKVYRDNDTARYIQLGDAEERFAPIGGGGSFIAANGLTKSVDTIKLGGTLTDTTIINTNDKTFSLSALSTDANKVVFSVTSDGTSIFNVNNLSNSDMSLGLDAGINKTFGTNNLIIGKGAAFSAATISSSNITGQNSCNTCTSVVESVVNGNLAGVGNVSESTIVGYGAGIVDNNLVSTTQLYGSAAGFSSKGFYDCNIIGYYGAANLSNAVLLRNSILIGNYTAASDNVNTTGGGIIHIGNYTKSGGFNNTIAIGDSATNTKTNQLVLAPKFRHLRLRGVDYELPASQGGVDTYLKNNGSGVLSWATVSGGGTTTNALTFNNSGTGDASGTTFNGSAARTLSYNSIGAAPLASPTFTGTVTIPSGSVMNTPASIGLANATGLPISSGVSGLGTGVATWLATPSSANLQTAITDETGTGVAVFGTAPTFTTNITTPIIIGGTGTTSPLIIRSTSGVGTTGSDIIFQNQTNGSNEPMRILSSGNVGIGTTTPQSRFSVTSGISVGSIYAGTNAAPANGAIIQGNVGIGVATPTSKLQVVSGTLTDGVSAVNVSAVMPTTMAGANAAIDFAVIGAGSSSFNTNGLRINYLAGYTGTGRTAAVNGSNTSEGIGNDIIGTQFNAGLHGNAFGATTGKNVGVQGICSNANYGVGGYFATTTAKNSATNIGIVGIARNTGTSPIEVGGWIGLGTTDPSSLISAGLIVDNSSVAAPILVGRDNGTRVFSIIDGGNVGIGNITPTQKLDVDGLVKYKTYTVSTLPTCNSTNQYTYATVTDALTPTYLTPVVGGGAVVAPVFCNTSQWVTH